MDSEAHKSGEDVDTNDSNADGTLHARKHCRDLNVSSSSGSSSSSETVSSALPEPPDGGWGWVVVFASFMINFIADGVSLSFGILFVDLVEYFGESKAKTSWAGSVFLSMPLLAGPVASYMADRYGCQRMCIMGALLSTVAFAAGLFAERIELLFLAFGVAGLGLALCYVTSIVVVAYYFEKRRSLATGLSACGTGIGTFVFPTITNHLLAEYHWQGTLLILSGFFLNMTVFGALMRDLEAPPKPPRARSSALEESERLCSSLVQLPTYLGDNLPLEVFSELSSKEGGTLNALLEQHPYLLNTIVSDEKEGERPPKKKGGEGRVFANGAIKKDTSFSARLDMACLHNMKLQRGSITYRGAMLNIRRYRLRASSCPDIYRNSMVTITEEKSCFFLNDLKELMLDMFDFSMFRNFRYTLFCLSNFVLYACVDVPYVYIPDHAHTLGTDMESASFLISVLGVLNTLGVVIVGYVGDKPWIEPSLLYGGFIALSGFSLAVLPVITNYYLMAAMVGIYGFAISANYALVPVIIVNLISLDSFTGAYGLLLLVQGIASLIGPPIAGTLFDMTGDYDITFYCTGICILVSGIMVVPVAKSYRCSKSSPPSSSASKEPVNVEPRNVKVRFQPSEDEDDVTAKVECNGGENSIPLLSEVPQVKIYENPLPMSVERV